MFKLLFTFVIFSTLVIGSYSENFVCLFHDSYDRSNDQESGYIEPYMEFIYRVASDLKYSQIKPVPKAPIEFDYIDNYINSIKYENFEELVIDGIVDKMIRSSRDTTVNQKLELQGKRNIGYLYFIYMKRINEEMDENKLMNLRQQILDNKILNRKLQTNLIQLIWDKIKV